MLAARQPIEMAIWQRHRKKPLRVHRNVAPRKAESYEMWRYLNISEQWPTPRSAAACVSDYSA